MDYHLSKEQVKRLDRTIKFVSKIDKWVELVDNIVSNIEEDTDGDMEDLMLTMLSFLDLENPEDISLTTEYIMGAVAMRFITVTALFRQGLADLDLKTIPGITAVKNHFREAAKFFDQLPSNCKCAHMHSPANKYSPPASMHAEDPDGGENQDDEDNTHPDSIKASQLASIMAQMEKRITNKLMQKLNGPDAATKRSTMAQILDDDSSLSSDYDDTIGDPTSLPKATSQMTKGTHHAKGKTQPKYSKEEYSDVDVDDPDILYFPLVWMDKARESTADQRQLMTTLKEQTRLQQPKHRVEQYQMDHMLKVLHLLFKGQIDNAIEQIAFRMHFLLKASKRQLNEAVGYYEHLLQAKRPMKEKEADIVSKMPKSLPTKQADFLLQQAKKGAHQASPSTAGGAAAQQGDTTPGHGRGGHRHNRNK